MLDRVYLKRIYQIAKKVSQKNLVHIEGPTFSGKTSFISDFSARIRQKGLDFMVIEEAAAKVLRKDNALFEQLTTYSSRSRQWKKAKTELQQKVLTEQIKSLELFAENDEFSLALMDRGGASTAYHTIPFLSEKMFVEAICKKIAKMANLTILFSPLGPFNSVVHSLNEVFPRYQKSDEEIELEYKGIKHYLKSWNFNYLEISSVERDTRIRISLKHVLDLLIN